MLIMMLADTSSQFSITGGMSSTENIAQKLHNLLDWAIYSLPVSSGRLRKTPKEEI